jgi:EAL domain-containing protein (putative c-di-GMP-specific phosphodiesterase class I)
VIGKRLSNCLPESACVARISADIFGFVVSIKNLGNSSNSSEIDVVHLIESTVLASLSEPHQIGERSVRLSARAGIALFPDDGNDSDSLLRNAEAALKSAKEARLRHLFYTAEMNARTAEKISLEYRLRRAFDEQQFVLYYQPKFDLQTGALAGMEALIRWQEPDVGLHLPGRFIQMLEDTGLIVDVGLWVIAQAHRQFGEWEAQGLSVPRIAVNVSQLQIRQKNFVDDVLRILGTAPRSLLEIEITESLFMDDVNKNIARDKLVSLREAGLTVAIDDFGTGYSSLSYLARLPIDTLKIDRSFITDMTASTESRAIVQTILSLARSLKLKVVAEGVETDAQRAQLQALGCDQMQGFLISPGVPAEQMAAMLQSTSLQRQG